MVSVGKDGGNDGLSGRDGRAKNDAVGVDEMLRRAIALHQAGRLEEAQQGYRGVLDQQRDNADALAMMGLLAHQVGRNEIAADFLRKALSVEPGHAEAALNLGIVLRGGGDLDGAIAQFRRVVTLKPDSAGGHGNLGLALVERGDTAKAADSFARALAIDTNFADAHNGMGMVRQREDDLDAAASHYHRAIALDSEFIEAHNNLGTVLRAQGALEEAIEAFRLAATYGPHDSEAQLNLGTALRALGRPEEATAPLRRLVALQPKSAAAQVELGVALQEQGKPKEALPHYRAAIALDPQDASAYRNTAIANLDLGQHDAAQKAFQRVFELEHGGPWWNAPSFADGLAGAAATPLPTAGGRASTFKLEDTVDQLEHLLAMGKLDPSFQQMVDLYRPIFDEVSDAGGMEESIALTTDQLEQIGGFYNRVVHYQDAPRIAEGAVNPTLDYDAISDSYRSSRVSLTTLDDFLTPAALASLQRFCSESTVFFKYSGARFVGTEVSGGFNCSLLYQIAEELKARMPAILGHHTLSNIWVYRHANAGEGVEAHTDQGAVTFNFWITPDAANLEPEHGGLVVYATEQPYDWDWRTINAFKDRPDIKRKIYDFLASAETVTIPYRENRALLFHSNLFHKSDRIRFRDGYMNRRINVTMLFGRRPDAVPA